MSKRPSTPVNAWTKKARSLFRQRIRSGFVTGEDIRVRLSKRTPKTRLAKTRLAKPSHHNAWGGLINGLVRSGLLIDSGLTQHMKTPLSHGRRTTVYLVA